MTNGDKRASKRDILGIAICLTNTHTCNAFFITQYFF